MDDGDKELLEAIALKFGLTWGEDPNVSSLIKAIAKEEIVKVVWADSPPVDDPKRKAVLAAIALIHEGLAKLVRLLD